jgi:hypothetical protein
MLSNRLFFNNWRIPMLRTQSVGPLDEKYIENPGLIVGQTYCLEYAFAIHNKVHVSRYYGSVIAVKTSPTERGLSYELTIEQWQYPKTKAYGIVVLVYDDNSVCEIIDCSKIQTWNIANIPPNSFRIVS